MANLEEIRKSQRANGPATILAIGTATPSNCIYQSDFTDYYFRVTKSEHMTQLKAKLKRICKLIIWNFELYIGGSSIYLFYGPLSFLIFLSSTFYQNSPDISKLPLNYFVILPIFIK
jgi:hypothetical protein